MPCSICHESGHNRRTCQNTNTLFNAHPFIDPLFTNNDSLSLHTPPAHYTNIRFTTHYGTDTANASFAPLTPETPLNIIPFPNLESLTFDDLFGNNSDNDTHESMPDLVIDMGAIKKNLAPLVDCVEEPCATDACPVCMEPLKKTDLFVSRCGHQFHSTCMIIHIKKHDNCPMCRGVLFTDVI
jgi:hypothetical protein